MKVQKPFYKGRKPGLFVNFGKFLCSLIWIRTPNTVSDPGHSNECGIHANSDTQHGFILRYAFIMINGCQTFPKIGLLGAIKELIFTSSFIQTADIS
jgi:hypothetical protein